MTEFPGAFWKDYELVDSGDGEKLERFGPYRIIRPEPKALWAKSMDGSEWLRTAHTRFRPGAGFGKAGKEESGTWERLRRSEDQWYIRYGGSEGGPEFSLRLGLTSFKHVGVFPEQAPNWDYIYRSTRDLSARLGRAPRVLNLFAYTGAASLAAKAAGADVTHLDSVRQVVTWARGNMERSGLDGIRWVVEDAMKFVRREQRRGNVYDGIIMDPPSYGRGPGGEMWKIEDDLFDFVSLCSGVLAEQPLFFLINSYTKFKSRVSGSINVILQDIIFLKISILCQFIRHL